MVQLKFAFQHSFCSVEASCSKFCLIFLHHQLKEKRRASGGGVGAIEELENAFNLAEESCPGISDRLVTHMMERVCRWHTEGITADSFGWSLCIYFNMRFHVVPTGFP